MKTHDITLLFFNKWAYEKGFALGVIFFFFQYRCICIAFQIKV